jgi:hypothetical protein
MEPTQKAKGSFDVTMRPPQPPYDTVGDVALGRMTIDKQFRGDLDATSVVEMTTCMGGQGSGGYVALERVTGTLQGRSGTFVLQHSGTMSAGQAQMSVTITPGSGTGDLRGISGAMQIDIVDGKHSYTLAYAMPE